jgi:hypothetical protein
MAPNPAYALVPVIGGLAVIAGTVLALIFDRRDQLREANPALPVLVRYVSQAAMDLKKRPHWILLVAMVVFCPCMMVTAVWQSQLSDKGDALEVYGIAAGASAVLLAAWPMGTSTGTAIHIILALGFTVTGINYAIQAQILADDRGQDGLSTARLVLWVLGIVGAALTNFTVYLGVRATSRIAKHQKGEQELSPAAIKQERMRETLLASGQLLMGTAIGASLLSATADVVDVDNNDNDEVLVVGLSSAAAAVAVLGLSLAFNDRLYGSCQAQPTD